VDIYSPDAAHRRVRVQFDRALSPAQRFNLALVIQNEVAGSVHMAGQDAIVVLPSTVTTTDMRRLRSTQGVYNARSQARPVDPVPQLATDRAHGRMDSCLPVWHGPRATSYNR
jgi:hypothetical protein